MFRVYTDNANNAFSFNDLAFVAHLLNRWSDFHLKLLDTLSEQSPENYYDSASASAAGPPHCCGLADSLRYQAQNLATF